MASHDQLNPNGQACATWDILDPTKYPAYSTESVDVFLGEINARRKEGEKDITVEDKCVNVVLASWQTDDPDRVEMLKVALRSIRAMIELPPTFADFVCQQESPVRDAYVRALLGDGPFAKGEIEWTNNILMPPVSQKARTEVELGRTVRVRYAVRTKFVSDISDMIFDSNPGCVIVVTGESGGGKTTAAKFAATSPGERFASKRGIAVDLGTARCFSNLPESNNYTASEGITREEAWKRAHDAQVATELFAAVTMMVPAISLSKDPNTTVSLIIDELGSRLDVLRVICRLVSLGNVAGQALMGQLTAKFRVDNVRIVAVGTGCDDAIHDIGSERNTYNIIRATKESAHTLWSTMVANVLKKSANVLHDSLLFMAISGIAPEKAAAIQGATLEAINTVPGGRLLCSRGKELVGNCRLAALFFAHASYITANSPTRTDPDVSALPSLAVTMAQCVVAHGIGRFIDLNGMASTFRSDGGRLGAIAQSVALMLNASDAALPEAMFTALCTQSGILTSHALMLDGAAAVPIGSRVVSDVRSGCFVVLDGGRRHRVSMAAVSMYLLNFGAGFRGTSGHDFELLTMDYLTVVAPAAVCVAEWARDASEAYRVLATIKDNSLPRFLLFDILAELFGSRNKGSCPLDDALTVAQGALKERFEPGNPDCAPNLAHLADAIAGETKGLVIAQNGPNASGADVFLLSPGYGVAVHLQNKCHVHSEEERKVQILHKVFSLLGEFVKMGAPAFDPSKVGAGLKTVGLPSRAREWPACYRPGANGFKWCRTTQCWNFDRLTGVTPKMVFNHFYHDRCRLKLSYETYPCQMFVVFRCVTEGNNAVGAAIGRILESHHATHANCRFVEVNEGDESALYPLSIARTADTAVLTRRFAVNLK